MTSVQSSPPPAAPDPHGLPVVRLGGEHRLAAAARLVSDHTLDPLEAAQRFLDSAQALKIDLSLMWGTLAPNGLDVRQVCLAVIGSGRTAMLFVSGTQRALAGGAGSWFANRKAHRASDGAEAHERLAVVRAACEAIRQPGLHAPRGIVLAQALLEAREKEAAMALRSAGFLQLGELAYMRRSLAGSLPQSVGVAQEGDWGGGVRVARCSDLLASGLSPCDVDQHVIDALARTYEHTLDCPELCGMRDIADVLDSHRQVGVWDPAFWWLVYLNNQPEGCLLLNACPEQDSVELVYIGVSPRLRGQGVARRLLEMGIHRALRDVVVREPREKRAEVTGLGGLTCAVDTRNAPAMALYRTLGFQRFAQRVPLVKSLR